MTILFEYPLPCHANRCWVIHKQFHRIWRRHIVLPIPSCMWTTGHGCITGRDTCGSDFFCCGFHCPPSKTPPTNREAVCAKDLSSDTPYRDGKRCAIRICCNFGIPNWCFGERARLVSLVSIVFLQGYRDVPGRGIHSAVVRAFLTDDRRRCCVSSPFCGSSAVRPA